jgi:hypothetical protein
MGTGRASFETSPITDSTNEQLAKEEAGMNSKLHTSNPLNPVETI